MDKKAKYTASTKPPTPKQPFSHAQNKGPRSNSIIANAKTTILPSANTASTVLNPTIVTFFIFVTPRFAVLHPGFDQLAGYAARARNLRKIVITEPSSLHNFILVFLNLATDVF